ncbi:Gfo/Idh/MocA family oxidoreductase [Streptosporangiaceae bacterium NEAU-GS5]|nr:Gfo/Idh/MocA family oxidoreductase [Streptosporangiaceae bacterium NEAU-GS5]
MSEIRVGLVGYGVAGRVFHAPLIVATPGLRLAAVVTSARRDEVQADHPGVEVVPSADELWERSDLVVIASPNRTHVPLARSALERGKAVVVDKPLARTAAEAADLVRLSRETGLMLTVFQNRRWDGDFLTIQKLRPELGEIRRFESRFERWRPQPKGGWREQEDPAEIGGLLYDLGSHVVDQALRLLGPVTEVYAEIDVRRAGVGADDDTFLALTHAGGARSHLWVSAVAPLLGPRFRVLGSEAGYVKYGLDPQEDALRSGARPGPGIGARSGAAAAWGVEPPERWGVVGTEDDSRTAPTEPGAYPEFYAGVARALLEGAPAPVEPESVVELIAVLEAARRSADTSSVVTL